MSIIDAINSPNEEFYKFLKNNYFLEDELVILCYLMRKYLIIKGDIHQFIEDSYKKHFKFIHRKPKKECIHEYTKDCIQIISKYDEVTKYLLSIVNINIHTNHKCIYNLVDEHNKKYMINNIVDALTIKPITCSIYVTKYLLIKQLHLYDDIKYVFTLTFIDVITPDLVMILDSHYKN